MLYHWDTPKSTFLILLTWHLSYFLVHLKYVWMAYLPTTRKVGFFWGGVNLLPFLLPLWCWAQNTSHSRHSKKIWSANESCYRCFWSQHLDWPLNGKYGSQAHGQCRTSLGNPSRFVLSFSNIVENTSRSDHPNYDLELRVLQDISSSQSLDL